MKGSRRKLYGKNSLNDIGMMNLMTCVNDPIKKPKVEGVANIDLLVKAIDLNKHNQELYKDLVITS